MTLGSKQISAFLIIVLILTTFPLLQLPHTSGDLINPGSLVSRGTIYINGDADFTSGNGVISGNGTIFNPYILENWSISAFSKHGIHIVNTNAYFIIRNCYVYNGISFLRQGIYLNNVENGGVENNRIVSNYNGIYLLNSDSNTISNNTCSSNRKNGIFLESSESNVLKDNLCSLSIDEDGIHILDSNSSVIEYNSCKSNNRDGIWLWNSKLNTITNNTCTLNINMGIFSRYSDSNIISNNTCINNDGGISKQDSNYNKIFNNNCSSNNRSGIYIWDSDNNRVLNNICNLNNFRSIYVRDAEHNTILNNSCDFNGASGIYLWFSDYNIISNNSCDQNDEGGILIRSSNYNDISNSSCNSNGIYTDFVHGITLRNSNWNSIIRNTCNSNYENGILVYQHSENNLISRNTCNFNNLNGISVYQDSDNNELKNNTCYSNNENGIFLGHKSAGGNAHTVENNICDSNNQSGIAIENSNNNIIKQNICNWNENGILLSGSINNKLIDNIMELCGILIFGKSLEHWNTHTIDLTNTINTKPVYYWKNQSDNEIPEGAGEVILANCSNIKISNQALSKGSAGILLGFTNYSVLIDNTCYLNNYYGIYLYSSDNNTINQNTIYSNKITGIHFDSSARNIINNCSIHSNSIYDLNFENKSKNNVAINTTINDMYFVDSNSELIIKNYLNIHVNDIKGNPIQHMDILVEDNHKKIYTTSGYGGVASKTNAKGRVNWILVTDRVYNGTTTAIENMTLVTVKNIDFKELNNSKEVNMSTSHFEHFYLEPRASPEDVELISPFNNSYHNDSTPELKWTLGNIEHKNLFSYFIQIDEFGGDWTSLFYNKGMAFGILNCIVPNTLPDGDYQWRVRSNNGFKNGSWSATWKFTIDTEPPTSEINTPRNNEYLNNLMIISGIASDNENGSGIGRVELSIERLSDNQFWDGKSWTITKSWLPSKGANNWTYNSNNVKWVTDSYYQIRTRAIDEVGNIELPGPGISFMYDNRPPESSIIINNGEEFTNSIFAELYLTAGDLGAGIFQMAFSTDGEVWTTWEQFNFTKLFELTIGDGEKIIFLKVQDRAGNIGTPVFDSIILDTTPPVELRNVINDGGKYTNSREVTLTLTASDALSGVSEMAFSSDGNSWSDWEPYYNFKSYTITPIDGKKEVYFKVNDKMGNIAEPVVSTIILDTHPPHSIFISINSGELETNNPDVNIEMNAHDALSGVHEMSFSIDGKSWTDWEPFISVKTFTLSANDGEKIIFLKVKDEAGNVAEPVYDTILLNTTTPNNEKKASEKSTSSMYYWVYLFFTTLLIVILLIIIYLIILKKKTKHKLLSKDLEKSPTEESTVELDSSLDEFSGEISNESLSKQDYASTTANTQSSYYEYETIDSLASQQYLNQPWYTQHDNNNSKQDNIQE